MGDKNRQQPNDQGWFYLNQGTVMKPQGDGSLQRVWVGIRVGTIKLGMG